MSTADVRSAIILAGGLGTRLRSAVPDLPKPMAPVRGRPFLLHQMDHWIAQGIRHFVLSVGYRHEAVMDGLGRTYRAAALDYVIERTPLGTGGALLLAAQALPPCEAALLLNGDTYFNVSLAALSGHARQRRAQWCLALFESHDTQRYMGVGVDAHGSINALREPGATWANGGVYWFQPRALDAVRAQPDAVRSLENDLFPQLWAQGQHFAGLCSAGAFLDIGIPEDYRRAAHVLPEIRVEGGIDVVSA